MSQPFEITIREARPTDADAAVVVRLIPENQR